MTKSFIRLKITCFLAACFMVCVCLLGCDLVLTGMDKEGRPVEPLYAGERTDREKVLEGRFSVMNQQVTFNDINISSDGRKILVSLEERAFLLDGEGRLLWENSFDQSQVSSAFSCCGNTMVSADDDGRISLYEERRFLWETFLDTPVNTMDVSDDAHRVMVLSSSPKEEEGRIYLLDKHGKILWEAEIPGITHAQMDSRGMMYLVQAVQQGDNKIFLYDERGELLWEKEGFQTAGLSQDGKYVTAVADQTIYLFDSNGKTLWSMDIGVPVTQIKFSRNNRYILAYNQFGAGRDNLIYLDIEGNLLWKQRIRDDSSVALSADGQRIVVASWRHYSEDLTRVSIYDARGRLRREIDAGSRADKIALSDDGGFLVLGCYDGNVYVLNLNRETLGEYIPSETENVYYVPVDQLKPLKEEETRIDLYFYDQNALVFVPVSREVTKTSNMMRTAIEELVKGPKVRSYLIRTIPKGIDIGISTEDGKVEVNLPGELEQIAGATQSTGIINSILYTLSQFPTVDSIKFMVEGEEKYSFGEPGVFIGQEFSSQQVRESSPLLFIPYRSGFRYYLIPWEIQPSPVSKDPAEFISYKYFQEAGSFIPCNVEIIEARVEGDLVTLDLNQEFLTLFENPENSDLKARAQVVTDGLVATLTENLKQNKVQILVEGENISPRGFSHLSQPLEKPRGINPEQ